MSEDEEETKPKMRWRTTFVIDSERDPRKWSLNNFYWAEQNDQAAIVKDRTVRIGPKRKKR